jgi:hypothetical protein
MMMITVGLMNGPTKNFNQGRKNMKRILLIMSLTIAVLTISQTAQAFGGKEVEVTKEYIVDECGCVVGRKVTRIVKVARRRPLRSLCECVEGAVECICRPLRRCCCERTKTVVVTKDCCRIPRRQVWRSCDCEKK